MAEVESGAPRSVRKNKSRGYQQLRVWQDAIELYCLTCEIARRLPSDLNSVRWQMIGSADSIHRNIAEGYCRRSLREYLHFLNVALGSLGESVSGYIATHRAKQLSDHDFERLDSLAFKIENGMLKLVESLQRKQVTGDWIDSLLVKESNAIYGSTPE